MCCHLYLWHVQAFYRASLDAPRLQFCRNLTQECYTLNAPRSHMPKLSGYAQTATQTMARHTKLAPFVCLPVLL
ncbi:hypothetical protein HanPSC8_Chr16g0716621 [Helianthus annuus]|nr:hypothetical protein HanPSC8_Chr16g0716621 [Helianthus annuus]